MKQLLTILMIGISIAFGQLDNKDIIVDSLDSLSLEYIGEGKKVKFTPLSEVDVQKAKKDSKARTVFLPFSQTSKYQIV